MVTWATIWLTLVTLVAGEIIPKALAVSQVGHKAECAACAGGWREGEADRGYYWLIVSDSA